MKTSIIDIQKIRQDFPILSRKVRANKPLVYLDNAWDYSVTTGKYRNIFLGEKKAETQAKIDSGEYILTDLN